MLVESVDGEHALLGRPRSLRRRGPVLTCLSGFIEQGESIEEAVSPSPARPGRPDAVAVTFLRPPSQPSSRARDAGTDRTVNSIAKRQPLGHRDREPGKVCGALREKE